MRPNSDQNEKLIGYYKLLSSERFDRDIATLMNSPFWVDALKKGFAKGVGDQLYSKF